MRFTILAGSHTRRVPTIMINVTLGIQEFVEACALLKFVECQGVLSLSDVQALLSYASSNEDGKPAAPKIIPISVMDYILGISDFVGELMRTAPSTISGSNYNLVPAATKTFFINMLAVCQKFYQGNS